MRVERSDRQREGRIGRRINQPVYLLSLGGLALVTGCRHHHDARVIGALHGKAQWVVAPRFRRQMAERQIDDLDPVGEAVVDGPVDRGNHAARRARSVGTERLQIDDIRGRGHA